MTIYYKHSPDCLPEPGHEDKLSLDLQIAALDTLCFPPPFSEHILNFYGHPAYANMICQGAYDVVDGENVLKGYIAFNQPWLDEGNDDWYIIRLGVHPNHRRQRIATRMLTIATHYIHDIVWMRDTPLGYRIFADIRSTNPASLDLFKKQGWWCYGADDIGFTHIGEIGIRMSICKNFSPNYRPEKWVWKDKERFYNVNTSLS